MTVLGWPHLHLREVDSTNRQARRLVQAGAPHGLLVTADAQSAGRGRQGRTWSAPAGRSLLASLVLRDPPRLLPLLAGVAVAETVMALTGREAGVKWPNDVLLDRRKVAGILVEGRPQERWAVLGIGLNVALDPRELPPELHARAGTLGLAPGRIGEVRGRLLGELERWLREGEEVLLERIRELDALRGERVRWDGGGTEGTGGGIDGDGRLIVIGADGLRHVLGAGEVHLSAGPG